MTFKNNLGQVEENIVGGVVAVIVGGVSVCFFAFIFRVYALCCLCLHQPSLGVWGF